MGHSLLKEVECEIGGQKIDKHYSHWLATWNQLTEVNPTGASTAVTSNNCGEPTGDATLYQMMSHNHQGDAADCVSLAGSPNKVMVPLQFWFNRNPGLALPLIALQYHEVKIKITFAAAGELLGTPTGTSTLQDPTLWAQYIYLDTDERRRFAQVSHEYLIEQLQFQNTSKSSSMNLNFNHPVKEIVWGGVPGAAGLKSGPALLIKPTLTENWHIKLNGHDRLAARTPEYFTRQQVYDHHPDLVV